MPMPSKYGNAKPKYKGKRFDSGLEMCRYIYLQDQERKGRISNLRRQVRYQVLPAQYERPQYITDGKGKKMPKPRVKERAVVYVADFVYTYNGVDVVEDAKGVRTDAYILKRKLMLYFHDISIYEVENAADPIGGKEV